jgi:hypothetical protein
LTLCATVVALGIGEMMARVVGPPAPSAGAGPRLYQFDSLLGWQKRPDVEVTTSGAEWDVVIATNEHGLRGSSTPAAKPAGRTRVLLVGDSFLEGYTVVDEETVSNVLEHRLDDLGRGDFEVLNGGTAGYATDQELLFFERDGATFEPDVTVLLFYLNDVWGNAQTRYWRGAKPYFTLASDTLALQGVPVPVLRYNTRAWHDRFNSNSALYRLVRRALRGGASPPAEATAQEGTTPAPTVPGEFLPWQRVPDATTAEQWRLTEALLVELRDQVEATGSEFLVFWIPSKTAVYDEIWESTRDAYGMSDEAWSPIADALMLRTICERAALSCLIPLDEFRAHAAPLGEPGGLYLPIDGHWTAAGHHLAAELLARAIAPDKHAGG